MIYYATYKETVGTKNDNTKTEEEQEEPEVVYTLVENSISYKSATNMCSMPYNFLFNLLQVSKNPEYVMAVTDLLLEESEIVLMIQDQMNVTTQTHIETYYHAKKTVEKQYRERAIVTNSIDPVTGQQTSSTDYIWDYSGSNTEYEYPSWEPQIITNVTNTYTNTATAFIQKANTWCMDFEQKVEKNNTDTPGELAITKETHDGELADLSYNTLVSTYESGGGSSKSEYEIYSSDEWLLDTTSDKLDTRLFGWNVISSAEKRINYEKFLGLWKNDKGEYYLGAKYDENGKIVGYKLPDNKGKAYPAEDIPDERGQNINDLVELLATHSDTQVHEELMMYYWNIYFGKDVYDVNIDNLLNLFSTEVFNSMGSLGFGSVSYDSIRDSITEEDIEYMARIVYAERGNGNEEQQAHVASVILNRVLSSDFPNTVFGVISQKYAFESYGNSMYNSDGYLNATVQAAVRSVVQNGDTTGGAVYFMTPPAAQKLANKGTTWFLNLSFMFNDVTGTEAPTPGGAGWNSTHNFYTTEKTLAELKPGGNSQIVEIARSKMGCPYVWGAHGPNSFDCSGLVEWVYRQVGIQVPWSTSAYKPYIGSEYEISFEQAQPGDILLILAEERGKSSGHAGIYIGNNQYIHAPSTGDVVKISDGANSKFRHVFRFK